MKIHTCQLQNCNWHYTKIILNSDNNMKHFFKKFTKFENFFSNIQVFSNRNNDQCKICNLNTLTLKKIINHIEKTYIGWKLFLESLYILELTKSVKVSQSSDKFWFVFIVLSAHCSPTRKTNRTFYNKVNRTKILFRQENYIQANQEYKKITEKASILK